MYRGSGFLLKFDYTIHLGVVDTLRSPELTTVWQHDIGNSNDDSTLADKLINAAEAIRKAYAPFGPATDTLVTKVLLGATGCLPACDSFFVEGFRSSGLPYSYLNASFITRLLDFCLINLEELESEQVRILQMTGIRYPLMKLVDMYFWQIGYELNS